MGKETRLTAEKANRSGISMLRASIVKFARAPQGTKQQALAFEEILRALASQDAKSKSDRAQQRGEAA